MLDVRMWPLASISLTLTQTTSVMRMGSCDIATKSDILWIWNLHQQTLHESLMYVWRMMLNANSDHRTKHVSHSSSPICFQDIWNIYLNKLWLNSSFIWLLTKQCAAYDAKCKRWPIHWALAQFFLTESFLDIWNLPQQTLHESLIYVWRMMLHGNGGHVGKGYSNSPAWCENVGCEKVAIGKHYSDCNTHAKQQVWCVWEFATLQRIATTATNGDKLRRISTLICDELRRVATLVNTDTHTNCDKLRRLRPIATNCDECDELRQIDEMSPLHECAFDENSITMLTRMHHSLIQTLCSTFGTQVSWSGSWPQQEIPKRAHLHDFRAVKLILPNSDCLHSSFIWLLTKQCVAVDAKCKRWPID